MIEGINFELNKENIRSNYDLLVDFFGDKIINGGISKLSIDENDLDKIINNLIEVINLKLQMGNELSRKEAEIFIYSLICYTLDTLNIDRGIGYDFVIADGTKLEEHMNGVCCQSKDFCMIYYNMNIINKFCNKNLEFNGRVACLSTICHELVHAKQYLDITRGVYSLDNFIISLENVLGLETFYKENYSYTRMEMDANNRGYDLLLDFCNMHDVYDSKVVEEFKACTKLINEYEFNEANCKNVFEDGKELEFSMEEYLLYKTFEYISKNKEIIKKYPLLSLIYHDDGSLCSISELFKKRKQTNLEDISIFELNKIYEYIINSYKVFMDRNNMFIEMVNYLEDCDYSDTFALRMIEKMHESKKNITMEEMSNNIKKRILTFQDKYFI